MTTSSPHPNAPTRRLHRQQLRRHVGAALDLARALDDEMSVYLLEMVALHLRPELPRRPLESADELEPDDDPAKSGLDSYH